MYPIFFILILCLFSSIQAQTVSENTSVFDINIEIKDKTKLKTTYIKVNEPVIFKYSQQINLYIYRFDHAFYFPFAPFIVKNQISKKNIAFDSVIVFPTNQYISFSKPELYFIQKDSLSKNGIAIRVVEESFPDLNNVEHVIEALTYISTEKEIQNLHKNTNNKKALDEFLWKLMNGDANKVRLFMKSYFKRVRYANEHYTTFKAGWKTDKGMIYIVFGKPLTTYFEGNTEIWSYPDNLKFYFSKKETILSNNHYIMERNNKYRLVWLQTVKRLREAKF